MPSPAYSLVGFMKERDAVNYLATACVPVNRSLEALRAEWQQARQKLGPPCANAGRPGELDTPAELAPYLERVRSRPEYAELFNAGATFRMVEIAPLLCYQMHVVKHFFAASCAGVRGPEDVLEMARVCLPETNRSVNVENYPQGNGLVIRSDTMNVMIGKQGVLAAQGQPTRYGIELVLRPPLVQVFRYQNRCYLHNGFHRAAGLLAKKVSHMPCLVRDVAEIWEVRVSPERTFNDEILRSPNPPTCGHLTEEFAYTVQLRKAMRLITIAWTEGIILEE